MDQAREQIGHDEEESREQNEDIPEGQLEEKADDVRGEDQGEKKEDSLEDSGSPELLSETSKSDESIQENLPEEKLDENPEDGPENVSQEKQEEDLKTEEPKEDNEKLHVTENLEELSNQEESLEDIEELPANVSQEKQPDDLKTEETEEDNAKHEVRNHPEGLAEQEESGESIEETTKESLEENSEETKELLEESPTSQDSKKTEKELTESLKIEESQGENQKKVDTAETTKDLPESLEEESTETAEVIPKNEKKDENREESPMELELEENLENISPEIIEESSKDLKLEEGLEKITRNKEKSLENVGGSEIQTATTEESPKDQELEKNLEKPSSEIETEVQEESFQKLDQEKNLKNKLENRETPGNTQTEPAKKRAPLEEDLPNEQVTLFLRQLVNQLWPELGANPELRLERASAKGDNYLGVVWRLQVATGRRSLVVKLPPQNRVRRKQFFARPCFLRETAAYEEFLPLAEHFQEKWRVPCEDRFRQHAHCFGTRPDEPNECIVLEDLSATGFLLHNRFLDLSLEQVRLVIRSYAKLHAISLAAKKQWPERMKPLQELVDIFEQRRDDHALGVYFENLKGSALSALISPEDDEIYRSRLVAYFSRGSYFDLLLPLVSGSNCEPFAVICHGDCWNNNILYKVVASGRVEDVRLIDWQLMRYASPVTDLAYFIFTCTSRRFRQEHLPNILEDYYLELGLHLERLDEKVDELMPRWAFEEQVQSKAAVGLLLAMMVLPIVTMQGQDVPDLQAISERIEAGATTDLHGAGFLGAGNETTFRQRMREVILDCVDFNYI
ncbi:uncharacterized protein pkm [Drosophila bipectinata]|uniref:uncharacterized protein pkm n=1 Tax=Drosophila bipectinata TaxID=42026 RepID=UPI001C899649|nr:uncharacterized protein LOC108126572 [Drosophila bipectinata]